MTSNVRNQGIAHLAFRAGGAPFCKSRRAHIVCTVEDSAKWDPICKRCKMKAATMRIQALRKAALKPIDFEEPPQPVDDGSRDSLYGQRMDSADMGEC
jgi:hypothetical protein